MMVRGGCQTEGDSEYNLVSSLRSFRFLSSVCRKGLRVASSDRKQLVTRAGFKMVNMRIPLLLYGVVWPQAGVGAARGHRGRTNGTASTSTSTSRSGPRNGVMTVLADGQAASSAGSDFAGSATISAVTAFPADTPPITTASATIFVDMLDEVILRSPAEARKHLSTGSSSFVQVDKTVSEVEALAPDFCFKAIKEEMQTS